MTKLITLCGVLTVLSAVNSASAATSISSNPYNPMYLKVDLGYSSTKIPKISNEDADLTSSLTDKNMTGFLGSVSVGYQLSNFMRADVALILAPSSSHTIKHDTGSQTDNNIKDSKLKYASYGLMANAYYDFNLNAAIIPYVTVGLGLNNSKISWDDDTNEVLKAVAYLEDVKFKNTTSLAYSAGAGIAYNIAPDTFLDLSYKALRQTGKNKIVLKTDNGHQEATLKGRSLLTHTLNLGVRMSF